MTPATPGARWVFTIYGIIAALVLLFSLPWLSALVKAESAWQAPLATESLLLDIAQAGDLLFAVGERGHILRFNQENGWQQQTVPTQSLLTAVDFATPEHGCAVGHEAVIVCTRNAGRDWQLVHGQPDLQAPLLDIIFVSADRVIAIGAYSLFLVSHDGGQSWQQREFAPSEADIHVFTDAVTDEDGFAASYDLHLNAIARGPSDQLYIAAEAGRLFKSADAGENWRVLPSPYRGSWFGVTATDDDLMVYGLRGHLYQQSAGSEQWQPLEHSGDEQLTDALELPDGAALVVGQGGTLLFRKPNQDTFRLSHYPGRPALQGVTFMPPDTLYFASERGILQLSLQKLQQGGLEQRPVVP